MVTKLNKDREESEAHLKRLGTSRETTREQQDFLSNVSDEFSEHMKDALDGIYRRSTFFIEEHRRLRAVVRNLNEEFATDMLKRGQKWYIVPETESDDSQNNDELLASGVYPRHKFLQDVVLPLVRSERGHELPGVFNHLLIGSLFRRQMEPWEDLAKSHIERVWLNINRFLEEVLAHITDETTCANLLVHVFDPAMKLRRQAVMQKLQEVLLPHRDYEPMNLDPSFSLYIPGIERENEAPNTATEPRNSTDRTSTGPPLSRAFEANDNLGIQSDQYACSNVLDAMQSYYRVMEPIFPRKYRGHPLVSNSIER
jgi:hypothetical protein